MKLALLAAGLTSMTAAIDRGDLDEAARQGQLAGPVLVEKALAAASRSTRLAGIVAAPAVEDRAELLPALAIVAGGPDHRTAVPAVRAARAIARELATHELADDLAGDDVATWRDAWARLGLAGDHFIEVRIGALDTAAALAHVIDPSALGFPLATALADPDPAIRIAAVELVPEPAPESAREPLATAVVNDAEPAVALGAAQALCADVAGDPAPVLAALGSRGIDRIRALVATDRGPRARDAARCLKR